LKPGEQYRCWILESIDACMQLHGFAIREPLGTVELPIRWQHRRDQALHVRHERMMIDADAVPLDQGEFRIVPAPAFAIAVYLGDLPDVTAPGRKESLHAVFGRGVEIARLVHHSRGHTREMNVTDSGAGERRRFDLERACSREVLARRTQHARTQLECRYGGSRFPVRCHGRRLSAAPRDSPKYVR